MIRRVVTPSMSRNPSMFSKWRPLQQPKPTQVLLRPADIRNHRFECSDGERVAECVIGNDYASAVGVPVDPMAASRPRQPEPVRLERPGELPGGDPSRDLRHTLT